MNTTTKDQTRAELVASVEKLERVLKALRADLKAARGSEAQRELTELRKYRGKFYEMRDRAELWEYRAKRYSDRLATLNIKNNTERA